jgi:hypothetical protein
MCSSLLEISNLIMKKNESLGNAQVQTKIASGVGEHFKSVVKYSGKPTHRNKNNIFPTI